MPCHPWFHLQFEAEQTLLCCSSFTPQMSTKTRVQAASLQTRIRSKGRKIVSLLMGWFVVSFRSSLKILCLVLIRYQNVLLQMKKERQIRFKSVEDFRSSVGSFLSSIMVSCPDHYDWVRKLLNVSLNQETGPLLFTNHPQPVLNILLSHHPRPFKLSKNFFEIPVWVEGRNKLQVWRKYCYRVETVGMHLKM